MTRPPVLVAASHGTSHPEGQRTVAALVRAVAASWGEIVVRGSFVDVQQPGVRQALSVLEPEHDAVVVPLLLSAGYHVHVDLARDARQTVDRRVKIAGARGPDPRLARVLARRLDEAGLASDDVTRSDSSRAAGNCNADVSAPLQSTTGTVTTW